MSGSVAKRIRKAVYGDMCQRETKYFIHKQTRTLVCGGLRKVYLGAKKEYRSLKSSGI